MGRTAAGSGLPHHAHSRDLYAVLGPSPTALVFVHLLRGNLNACMTVLHLSAPVGSTPGTSPKLEGVFLRDGRCLTAAFGVNL